MLFQGLILMVAGMGVVFVFLVIMILMMNLLAVLMKPLARIIPEPEEKKVVKAKKAPIEDHEDIAVAIAAVNSFSK
ncbi:MAG TPA: OadG family protein [Chitinispirillaceae bacterium]|nr:OadG family protein [Chitinispirillaceae bacterium]